MSENTFRLAVVICLVVIAGVLGGALVSIGMDVHDLRDAAQR